MLRLLAAIPLILLGDIAPPVGFVENCTVEKQKKSGEECVSCTTFFAEADKCVREHGSRGFEFRCKTRGGSKWAEVWCKSGSRTVISSLQEPADAGAPVAHDAGPSPVNSAPTATSAPSSPAPAPAPTSEPSEPPRTVNATPEAHQRSPEPPPAEKRGGCGACRVDRESADRFGFWMLLVGFAVWALRRAG